MNILTAPAPKTVEIDGAEIPINWDFRASIHFEIIMGDASLSDEEKIEKALETYYPQIPYNLSEAVDRMLWFYRAGKDVYKRQVDDLITDIYKNLSSYPAKLRPKTQYGQPFEVRMLLTGPNGKTAYVKTGWIINAGDKNPRLTSAYVDGR